MHQPLYNIRNEGMAVDDAIMEATSNRIRPIFMSTTTSVFGMMPLVLFPGAGSELYRGLGSVVLGGLALSAVLTLTIVPPLLTLVAGTLEERRTTRLRRRLELSPAAWAPRIHRDEEVPPNWSLVRSIVILPGTALVFVAALILWAADGTELAAVPAAAHWVRYFRADEAIIAGYVVPVWWSLILVVVTLVLTVWMLLAARGSG